MKAPTKKRSIWMIMGIAAACLIVTAYLLYPMGFGLFASIRVSKAPGTAPAGFADVELNTADGVKLAGWWRPGANGAAIILLPGSNSNRDAQRPYADFLSKSGYGVLAIDLRGHGASGGNANAYGWQCLADVAAAVEFLKNQPGVQFIGALGLSMGGETLLGAASYCPEIKAIVSEGASHRCTADYLALPSNQSLIRSWTTRVMYWSVGLFTGQRQPTPIVYSIQNAPGTSYLLIAAGTLQKEIDYNSLFEKAAGESAALWAVPGVGHTGAYAANGEEYAERVTKFFNNSLLPAADSH